MTKIKTEALVADWLSDSIDAEDVETLTAFRRWLRMSYGHGAVSFVVQDAWAELPPGGGAEETVH